MDIYLQTYRSASLAPGSYTSSYRRSSSQSSYSAASRSAYQTTSSSPPGSYISRNQAAPVKSTYYPGSYCKRRGSTSSVSIRHQSPTRSSYEAPVRRYQSPARSSYEAPVRRYQSPARSYPSTSHGYQTPARSPAATGGVSIVITHGAGGEPVPVMARAYKEPEFRLAYDNYAEDDVYLDKMQDILSAYPCMGVPPEPSPIMGTVFLGTSSNAENFRLLKKNKISYILNCAGGHPVEFRRLRDLYAPEDTGVMGYEELMLEDRESCRIKESFAKAHKFIDFARSRNGRVLICCPGVSRSGAIAISYLIANGSTLLEAVRQVKTHRRVALCNVGFMKQLVSYARTRGALDSGITGKKSEKSNYSRGLTSLSYSNRFDRYRIYSASMPRIIRKAY